MNSFAKFEKFLPHSIIIPRLLTVGSQMPELDQWEGFFCTPYKLVSRNTPYKLGLPSLLVAIPFTRGGGGEG